MSEYDFLKEIPLFISLDEEDLSKIMRLVTEDTYEAGTILFRQGDPGDAFYIIKDGSVAITKTVDTREIKVASLRRGDFFGETALIDGESRTATVTFEQPSVLCKILREDFDYLMRVNLSISLKIMKEANRRLLDEQKKTFQSDIPERHDGSVIAFFSSKGGTGKSFIALNMAVALKKNSPPLEVAVLDLDLQFGDIAIYMNIMARKSIIDLVDAGDNVSEDALKDKMYRHDSGVWVLAGPQKPEMAEKVTRQHIARIIEVARNSFDIVVVDTSAFFQDVSIQVMDLADIIYLVTSLDLSSIKNAKQALEVMQTLNYDSDKVRVLVNMDSDKLQIRPENVESSLSVKLACVIPEDRENALASLNAGKPLVMTLDSTPVSKKISELAALSSGAAQKKESPGLFEKIKDIYGSISKWKKVTELHPEYSQAYYALGLAYKTKGLLNEAIIEYKRALELNPNYADANFWLGKAYFQKGMHDDAIKYFRRACEINPVYKEALTALGASLTAIGESDEAIEILIRARDARQNDVGYPDIHFNMGLAYYKKSMISNAMEEVTRAIELNQNYLDAYVLMGDILEGSGQVEEAVKNYQKAYALAESREDVDLKVRIKDKMLTAGSR